MQVCVKLKIIDLLDTVSCVVFLHPAVNMFSMFNHQVILCPVGGSANGEFHTNAVSCRVWFVSPHKTLRLCSTWEVTMEIEFTKWDQMYLFRGTSIYLISFLSQNIGHIIVFTDQSGMNASGHVMLGTMDVHHQWSKVHLFY